MIKCEAGAFKMEAIKKNFSDLGYYEKRLLGLLSLATIPGGFMFLQPLVVFYTPAYYCDGDAARFNYTNDWNQSIFNVFIQSEESSCYKYNKTLTRITANQNNESKWNMSKESVPCDEFVFGGIKTSLVTEFQLVCQNSWEKPFTSMIYMLGMLVGGLGTGFISDRFGRKKAFHAVQLMCFISCFIASFAQDMLMFKIMAFLIGAFAISAYQAILIISIELVTPEMRYLVNTVQNVSYSIGVMTFALSSFLVDDWRWFLRGTGLLGLLYLPYFSLLDETPQWLLATGKKETAVMVLEKVAKINKRPKQTIEGISNFLQDEMEYQQGVSKTLMNLLKQPVLMGWLFIMCLSWFIVAASGFTIWLNTNNLSGDRFLNMLFLTFATMFGSLLFYVLSKWISAKVMTIGSMGLTCILIGIASWLSTVLGSGSIITVITILCEVTLSVLWISIYALTGEIFPTNARHTFMGICSFWARIGGICAPYFVYAGENGSTVAISLGISTVLLVSAVTCLFLPDTHNKKLPQNVEEALKVKRSNLFTAVICRASNSSISLPEELDEISS